MSRTFIFALIGAMAAGLLFFWLGDSVPDGSSLWISDLAKLTLGALFFGWLGYLFLTRTKS